MDLKFQCVLYTAIALTVLNALCIADSIDNFSNEDKIFLQNDKDYFPINLQKKNDFFMKTAKSIPRIGRRNDFFFAKTAKSVPRIGRRNDFEESEQKKIERRATPMVDDLEAVSSWPWFREDYIPGVMKKKFESDDLTTLLNLNSEIEERRFQPLKKLN